jgi:hypothetical protein
MKSVFIFISMLGFLCLLSTPATAVLLDDFSSGDLSAYTKTVILDQDSAFEVSFVSTGGAIQVSKSSDTQAEQVLFMLPTSIGIGEILRVDKNAVKSGSYIDFGIAVAKSVTDPPEIVYTSGTVSSRANYVAIYLKSQYANIGTIGFNATSQVYSSSGIWSSDLDAQFAATTGLYIKRLDSDSWETGYTTASGDVAAHVFDGIDAGGAVGLFADVRAVTTYGDLDNLRIVPEPSTIVLVLMGLVSLGIFWLRRK